MAAFLRCLTVHICDVKISRKYKMWEINKEMYAGVDFHTRGWDEIIAYRQGCAAT